MLAASIAFCVGRFATTRGHNHFHEDPVILRKVDNLERRMYLVRFNDGAETFVFPGENEV